MKRYALWIALALTLLLSAGCGSSEKPEEKAIAQVYAGPVTLKLRSEIYPDSKHVIEVNHGEPLDVLQVRRRFVRVRSQNGVQGWTEMRNLLGDEKLAEIQDLRKYAAKLPSQGEATVYGALNVHIDPSRRSTNFYQIREGMKVDVVDHRLVPRSNKEPPMPFSIQKKAPPPRRKKKKKEPEIPPVPRPAGPALPANWVDLSKSTLPPEPPEPPPPPVPTDDWSLVRTKEGHAGWVLTRALVMAIPDEVAQYSEGARITSYFALGDVRDGDKMKHHWVWTTIRGGDRPYEFDSFRVFIYMLRRHRYETALIERNIEGYYPVIVERGETPKFTLILREKDGKLYRKTWVLEGYNARKISEEPYEMPKDKSPPLVGEEEDGEEEEELSIAERVTDGIKDLIRKAGFGS